MSDLPRGGESGGRRGVVKAVIGATGEEGGEEVTVVVGGGERGGGGGRVAAMAERGSFVIGIGEITRPDPECGSGCGVDVTTTLLLTVSAAFSVSGIAPFVPRTILSLLFTSPDEVFVRTSSVAALRSAEEVFGMFAVVAAA